jgi:hypothetical protein
MVTGYTLLCGRGQPEAAVAAQRGTSRLTETACSVATTRPAVDCLEQAIRQMRCKTAAPHLR